MSFKCHRNVLFCENFPFLPIQLLYFWADVPITFLKMNKFDFLASLLDFGLSHVVEQVLDLLEVEDLSAVQLVSKLWSVLFAK